MLAHLAGGRTCASVVWRTNRPGRPQRAQRGRVRRPGTSASRDSSLPPDMVTSVTGGARTMPEVSVVWESLMRHFLLAGAIARLAGRVVPPAPAALLIPSAGVAHRRPPRLGATRRTAIPIAAIAVTTQIKDAPAVGACADDKPKGIQAPPRSGGAPESAHWPIGLITLGAKRTGKRYGKSVRAV
jgi:hypothetical protein